MQIELLNDQGQASAKYEAPETLFGRDYNEDLVHQIVVAYRPTLVKALALKKTASKSSTPPKSHSSKRAQAVLVLV